MRNITINYTRHNNNFYIKFEVNGNITNTANALERTDEEHQRFTKMVAILKGLGCHYDSNNHSWHLPREIEEVTTETIEEIDHSGLFDSIVKKEIKVTKKIHGFDALEREMNKADFNPVWNHYQYK